MVTKDQIRQTNWTLLAYGGLAMPLSLAVIPIVNYLPAFYAQELHLSVGLVGLVFLCARLWDGFIDLFIGWLSDRSMSRWGRRKPWAIVGAPLLMISTWYLCNPPDGAGLVYLVIWAALFYTAWTVIYIPYLSWGAELATDYVERSRVTSFRETFSMLGNLFFAAAPLIFLAADAPLREVLFLISITVLLLVPLTTLPLGLWVRDVVPMRRNGIPLFQGIALLARDRVLVRFIVAVLLIFTGEGAINSLAVFAFRVGLQLPDKLFWVIFIIYVATLCALPLTLRLGKRVEKHWLLIGGIAIKAAGYGLHFWVPAGNFPIVAALWVVIGVAHTSTLILPTSILADIIDHGEVNEGERRSGAYVAIYNLAMKIGLALGVGLSFGLLDLANYDPGATQYDDTDSQNIRLIAFVLPCLLLASAAILLVKHPITKKVQHRMRETINLRHEEKFLKENC